MTCLLVDEGNTSAKYAVLNESGVIISLPADNTPNHVELKKLSIDKVIMASVKQSQDSVINSLKQLLPDAEFVVVNTQPSAFGLQNAYVDYARLGIDRWLAMLGAMDKTCAAYIVVDAGTAVTIDVVDGKRNHLGGWILPNVNFSAETLAQRSGKIELRQPNQPAIELGKVTEACVFNGLYASQIALIETLISQMRVENPDICLYLCGGDAPIYQSLLNSQGITCQLENQLVFAGLAKFANPVT